MPFDPHVYRLASVARDKLCREAARDSHNLRVLVAHANILDELLIELNAPREGPTEHYGFDLLPKSAAGSAERAVRRKVVVTVTEASQHELEDEAHHEASAHLISNPSSSSVPMLYHDSESESDSGSDSDGDSGDDEFDETVFTPSSPTDTSNTSMSSVDEEEPDEEDLALVRTKSSIWRFFGGTSTPSKEAQKQKDITHIDALTKEFQRFTVSST
jgi:hypothetical protein